jgi:hypothetical protein
MQIDDQAIHLSPDEFARRFPMRAGNLMWLLGAGASASAGIPTAGDMIWEFKQQLYVSQKRVHLKSVNDLSNPAIRNQLQAHIDSSQRFPKQGAAEEYAALFEAAWPDERDRQTYLDSKLSGAKPSYGHLAMATLTKAGLTKIVWTTNFDPLIADGAAKVFGSTGALTTAALDAPDLAAQAISHQRWPLEVKIHGDFRSRRLKNTTDELRQQDAKLRRELVDACRMFGLIVVGYSGRDKSVMEALQSVLDSDKAYPAGLFWLHRGEEPPSEHVLQLLRRSRTNGVDAGWISIANFDEALRDLIRLCQDLDTTILDAFASERRAWTAPPRPDGRKVWPVLRLNALQVIEPPGHCRRLECKIGGTPEVRAAVEDAGADVIVARTQAGVLAFGKDADLRSAFDGFGITTFDLHAIENRRLRYDSGERGLLRQALSMALAREHDLDRTRRRITDLLAPRDPDADQWKPLRKIVGQISGTVGKNPELTWKEGVGIRLDWADEKLWLLAQPRIVLAGVTDENKAQAADLARERTVRRYNKQLNDLIAFWTMLLAKNSDELRALNIGDGVDAVFRLGTDTAFSWRLQP